MHLPGQHRACALSKERIGWFAKLLKSLLRWVGGNHRPDREPERQRELAGPSTQASFAQLGSVEQLSAAGRGLTIVVQNDAPPEQPPEPSDFAECEPRAVDASPAPEPIAIPSACGALASMPAPPLRQAVASRLQQEPVEATVHAAERASNPLDSSLLVPNETDVLADEDDLGPGGAEEDPGSPNDRDEIVIPAEPEARAELSGSATAHSQDGSSGHAPYAQSADALTAEQAEPAEPQATPGVELKALAAACEPPEAITLGDSPLHASPAAAEPLSPDLVKMAKCAAVPGKLSPAVADATGDQIAKYRPRLRPRSAPTATRTASRRLEQEQVGGALEAMLLLSFMPGGWGLSLSVLLSRSADMPENIDVRMAGSDFSLFAIDDGLFEPVSPPSAVNIASTGFAVQTITAPPRRWLRTARDLHVFSERSGVAGFASIPRALIGQENVILCRSSLSSTAAQCAAATASEELEEVVGPGVPDGWRCFRSFRPKHPADFRDADDIFLALNPLPDAAIELSGGISTARSTWILGAPPRIRILGADPSPGELTIDGNRAERVDADEWSSPGWGALGLHTVRFAGLSRTYEIVEVKEEWAAWATDESTPYSTCGGRISTPTLNQAFAVYGEPCWLLGAYAGDVAFAARSPGGIAIAAPTFRPVWLVSVRRGGRLSSARALPYRAQPQLPRASGAADQIALWSSLLRGASAPVGVDERELWRAYRTLARKLRRRRR